MHRAAREALTETRLVVGRLRAEDEAGIDRLDDLVGAARGPAGVDGRRRDAAAAEPARASLAAYRIVQEALGNTARYAPGARVAVEVRYGTEVLTVSVADEGAATAPGAPGGGDGLVGMVERVTALGGAIEAGPRGGGLVGRRAPALRPRLRTVSGRSGAGRRRPGRARAWRRSGRTCSRAD